MMKADFSMSLLLVPLAFLASKFIKDIISSVLVRRPDHIEIKTPTKKVSIPLHGELTADDLKKITEEIKKE
jgi:hypothetical protein